MPSINEVRLIGYTNKNREVKTLTSGTQVYNFSLATNRKVKDKETTDWHRVVAYGKTAELMNNLLSNANESYFLYVEGYLDQRKWEDSSGETRYTTEVVASNFLILNKKDQ